MDWTLRFTPVPDAPCLVTPYGQACGATIAVGNDLLEPGRPYVDLTVAQQPTPWYVIAGFQRQSIPIAPCTLLNEALVVLAMPGRFYFDPPAMSGFSFLLQGAAIVGSQFVMSAGLDLTCQ